MIVSLLLAAATAQSVPMPTSDNATLRVSLRIVEACNPAIPASPTCTPTQYEQWLREHASRRTTVDEQGRPVLEIKL